MAPPGACDITVCVLNQNHHTVPLLRPHFATRALHGRPSTSRDSKERRFGKWCGVTKPGQPGPAFLGRPKQNYFSNSEMDGSKCAVLPCRNSTGRNKDLKFHRIPLDQREVLPSSYYRSNAYFQRQRMSTPTQHKIAEKRLAFPPLQ